MYMTLPYFSIINLASGHFTFFLAFGIDEVIQVWVETYVVMVTSFVISFLSVR